MNIEELKEKLKKAQSICLRCSVVHPITEHRLGAFSGLCSDCIAEILPKGIRL